jgi:hypothetical protein
MSALSPRLASGVVVLAGGAKPPVRWGRHFGGEPASIAAPQAPVATAVDVIAPSKLGKGGRDVTSTPRNPFVGTLRVEARPVASDQRLEASLASKRGNLPGEA